MAYKDLHEEPFNETTITKLEIFEDYAEAWIPVFVMSKASPIMIVDFFAGTGFDKNGVPGSPIRLLEKINKHRGIILKNNVKLEVHFNEYEPNKKTQRKFDLLKTACDDYLKENEDVLRAINKIHYHNEDFETLLPKLMPQIKLYPSLVYLDQNGVRFLSEKYLSELERTSKTDFLYFVSSSYFLRFGDSKEFSEYLKIDMDAAKKIPFTHIHRFILEHVKINLPENSKLMLYPFSLKKGSNVYGIIFGAKHPRAVDKFLDIVWKKNEINGQANFDIDEDEKKVQLDLFDTEKNLTKIKDFQKRLRDKVLSGEIKTNKDALDFVYNEGHFTQHAKDCLEKMKENNEVFYENRSPLINYDKVYKEKKIINYKILKNEIK